MEIQSYTFTVATASQATGVSADSIKNWTKQGVMVGHGDIGGGGSAGRKRTYTFQNIMEIAVAGALLDLGIKSVSDAFLAAARFAHTGDDERDIGMPYHYRAGDTFLYMSGKYSHVALNETDVVPFGDINRALRQPVGFIALNLTAVFVGVCKRMNIDLDKAFAGKETD